MTAHTNTDATAVCPHMHMKLLTCTHTHTHTLTSPLLTTNTHTQMHWDVLIGRAGVSWEYESGSMTSLLFTGIRSSLPPSSLSHPPLTLSPSLSNHIDAVTRLVMSKAHLTAFFPYGGDLTHVTESFELPASLSSWHLLFLSLTEVIAVSVHSDAAVTVHNERLQFLICQTD